MKKILIILIVFGFSYAYFADKKIADRNKRIGELENELQTLKRNIHTDSVINEAVATFRKSADSLGIRVY